jgi:hypothetical protein
LQSSGCHRFATLAALNPRSRAAALQSGVLALLQAAGVHVLAVPSWSDAADVALISHATSQLEGANEETKPSVLMCITQDLRELCDYCVRITQAHNIHSPFILHHFPTTRACCKCMRDAAVSHVHAGFAQLLAYAADRGIYTLAVGPFRTTLRPAAAALAPAAAHMERSPLCQASHVGLRWLPTGSSDLQPGDLQYMHNVQLQARLLQQQLSCDCPRIALPAALTVDVADMTSIPGTVQAVWLNPGRL